MDADALAQLAKWGISPDLAQQCGLFDTRDAGAIIPGVPSRAAIVIPYFEPAGGGILQVNGRPFARLRWLDAAQRVAASFVKRREARYGQPPHTGVQVYFPPVVEWGPILTDPTVPLVITEGEAKAIVACANGYTCLALGGVYNFTDAASGELVPVLAGIEWAGRSVVIIFDSDAATNPDVLAAESRLVEELQTKRGARCRIVRLPAAGDDKVGLDDFLNAKGADELEKLITASPDLSALDAKIIALNRTCAWVDQEGKVYDRTTGLFITVGSFVQGSAYSAITHIAPGSGPRAAPKIISVAQRWLTHPHAQRYAEVLFRPGEGETLTGEHGRALNIWRGWDAEPGSIKPWLDLAAHLFHRATPELRELPIKLLAYKAQNPMSKIPLAPMLIGTTGSGKTLWVDCACEAFHPYSANIRPSQLGSEYQGYLEKSVMVSINEMDELTMRKHYETIKALITDQQRPMNEKYRVQKEVKSPAMYWFTANLHGVASLTYDDRRFIVYSCPAAHPEGRAFYDRVLRWRELGGPRHLMHWLLNYDLKGWRPPPTAPMTAEKYMAYREGLTAVQMLAEDMRTSGPDVVVRWLDAAASWASIAELSPIAAEQGRAKAVRQSLSHFQVRPFYTPEELALMHPAILSQVYSARAPSLLTPGQLSRELRDAGIPYLVNADDPRGFLWQGAIRQFLVVSNAEEWARPEGIHQADFERLMRSWPSYTQLKNQMAMGARR